MKNEIIPKLSFLGDNDLEKFNSLYSPSMENNIPSYEKSWAYLNFWFSKTTLKYYDEKSFIVINCEKNHNDWIVSIIKPYDIKNVNISIKILDFFCHFCDVESLSIRYYYEQELISIKNNAIKNIQDRFPQNIYDLLELYNHSGSIWAPFRLRINRFINEYRLRYKVIILDSYNKQKAYDVLSAWYESFKIRTSYKDYNFLPDIDWYDKVIDYYCKSSSVYDQGIIIEIDDCPFALGCFSQISMDTIGIYTNIASTTIKGLSEFLLFSLAERALNHGYKYANIGHASRESEFQYKNKMIAKELRQVSVLFMEGMRDSSESLDSLLKEL